MTYRHRERHKLENIGWLRAAVLGANDGIVSTSSLILGVAASHATHNSILIAGIAGLVAGAMSMVRHHFAMMNGINPEYASKENPLQPTKQTVESGKKLFEQNCARCHGSGGRGDGRWSRSVPAPSQYCVSQ
jgi:mono/diheme cytochrome c family protein